MLWGQLRTARQRSAARKHPRPDLYDPGRGLFVRGRQPAAEHEWRVLERIKLPDGKLLIPGAVTHSNVMIEHPETIADRIERWARVAGRENVIFGNDCGFQSTAGNSEIPVTVAWAKLQALGEGARIASARLWH